MENDTKLKLRHAPSISRPVISPFISIKRKKLPDYNKNGQKPYSSTAALPVGMTDTQQCEYEKGCITCEVHGTGMDLRDGETCSFTLKHWEAHRLTCSMLGQPGDPAIYTPEITAEPLSHSPAKRRRTKRTEEERINYLKMDSYVAQFEAYRVLCGSCDKWIKLRPNSTYCSIPWDAHKKSCLAKKVTLLEPVSAPPFTEHQIALDIGPGRDPSSRGVHASLPHSDIFVSPTPSKPGPIFAQSNNAQPLNHTFVNTSFHGCNPSNYPPIHESLRRRNTEQRVTDSSDCGYPWLQQHGKYLERHIFDKPSFQPPQAHNGHPDFQCDTAISSIPQSSTIAVENPISEANDYLLLVENTNNPTATNVYNEGIAQRRSDNDLAAANHCMPMYAVANGHTTYNPELQMLLRNYLNPSYYLDDLAADSTLAVQSPDVAPTLAYNVTPDENADRPAFTNAYIAQGVRNSNALGSTHNPQRQTPFSGVNNVQSSNYPNLVFGTMEVDVPTSINYLALDENTDMYSRRITDCNTVNWQCHFSGCQYVSRSKRDMKRHCSSLRHGGFRVHMCEYCGKSFVREDTLSRHVKETCCRL